MVCGPTACGKSAFADDLSEALSTYATLIDSMQVYREIPVMTNQARRRPARLSGIISVSDGWSVADHRSALRRETGWACGTEPPEGRHPEGRHPGSRHPGSRHPGSRHPDPPFVLDAGTGMYLNACILDIPLAPRAPAEARGRAESLTEGEADPRRAARAKELEISGGDSRGSIWGGGLLYDTKLAYIRPGMGFLEEAIRARSRRILSGGVREAEALRAMAAEGRVAKPVLDSIGARELMALASGELDASQAEERMNIRTRRLAKRQIRWFDKLARTLAGRAEVAVLDPAEPMKIKNTMHDIIGSWNL